MVEVMERSFVVPAGEIPRESIWLSNLDLVVARAHTPTVYFYEPNGGPDFFAADVLKGALGRALVQFYPLAGRLGFDQDGRLEIKCTGEGVLFVVARSELTVADFGDFAPSDEMRNLLVPTADSSNPPLVMLQVTSLKCGGVCLGAAVHHTAADGLAALQFINSWSDIARGGGVATLISDPFLDRTLLRARSPPVVKFEHSEYSPKPPRTSKPLMATAHLSLSKQHLNHLKKSGLTSSTKPLSTFKAVAARVWRSACRARSTLEPGRRTRMYVTADARSRMRRAPLSPGYFGNAIFRTSASAAVGEVLSSPVEFLVDRISGGTDVLDDEFVWSLVDYLETKEDLNALQKAKWVMPETDLWLISWQGLPIYEADFGWGKPVFMGRACLQFPGLVYLMNNRGEDGGMTLAVSLEPENMERFKMFLYEGLV